MTVALEDLDQLARRVDPDRWLATRFAPAAARPPLIGLIALNHELARVGESVSNPLAGEIRLAWWREQVEALPRGAPPAQPALAAVQPAVLSGALPTTLLETMVEARHADLEPQPFGDEAALIAYIDGTAGALMAASAKLLDPAAEPPTVTGAARAWGWTGILRAGAAWADRSRQWRPAAWGEASDAEVAGHVAHRVDAALSAARSELTALPIAAFPAVAYAALARPYLRRGQLTDLGKRARLVGAVMRGSI